MSISNFEYKKMRITCLGPVHITDETGTVYSHQYLYDSRRQKVYFLNERRWVKFLYEHDLLQGFEKLIGSKMYAGTLCEWLLAKGFDVDKLNGVVAGRANVAVAREVLAANKTRLTEVVRTVHSVDGKLYIPGSSIKGALRTGILYGLLLQEDKLRSRAWDGVVNILEDKRIRDKNSALARLAQQMEITLLHRLQIPKGETGGELLPQTAMNCSIMKGLSVSDSYGSGKTEAVIVQKREAVYNVKTGQVKPKNLNLFRECLPPGTQQHFSITLDKAVFGAVGVSSISALLKTQQDFISFVMSRHKKIFGSALKRELAQAAKGNLFLGSGSGFFSKTLLAVLAPNEKAYTAAAALVLHNNFYKHAHLRLDKFVAPRALQTAKTPAGLCLMGICAVTEE